MDHNLDNSSNVESTTKTVSALRMFGVSMLFLAVLMFILLISGYSTRGSATQSSVSPIQTVTTQEISYQETYVYQRDYIGQVEAEQVSETAFEVSGKLKKLLFDEGDAVKQGEKVAELDTERLKARKKELAAALKRAEADARLAERTYDRFAELWENKAISSQEKDESLEAKEVAKAAVDVAKAQLNSIVVDIQKSTLFAPFDGVVIQRLQDAGSVVAMGQPVMQIQQNSAFDIRIGVTTKAAKTLTVGENRSIRIENEDYDAEITSILPVRAQTRTVDVKLALKQDVSDLRPGDTVSLSIDFEVKKRGFWVPLNALAEGHRGLWSIYVSERNEEDKQQASRRSVELHYSDGMRGFISGAINNGESVILQGASKLVPGQTIQSIEG